VVAYRVLPAPYADGRPLATGAKRQTVAEVKAVLEEALGLAVSGWAVSATRTAGIEASFGPQGTKLVFRSAAAVAPRIPMDDPAASGPPAPITQPERLAVEAGALLQALGLVGPNGQVRRDDRRKYNQIVHFLRLLDDLARKLPTGREVLVVDCGCGKSQLLFVLDYWLVERLGRKAFFVGLDVEPRAVAAARRLQGLLGYGNMEFVESTIAGWDPPRPPDLVLSPHACDTATDEAIALGVRSGSAGIVAVPCCQHDPP